MPKREKITYKETYKPHMLRIQHHKLPRCVHFPSEDFYVAEAEIRSAGSVVLDGAKYEFQDIRLYIKSNTD